MLSRFWLSIEILLFGVAAVFGFVVAEYPQAVDLQRASGPQRLGIIAVGFIPGILAVGFRYWARWVVKGPKKQMVEHQATPGPVPDGSVGPPKP
jgi:hypothetical protein